MDVTLDPRASRLLALMHEADTEAVTLDELEIAGVEDPARALHALELAGFAFERVTDRTAARREVECVRLAREAADARDAEAARTAAASPAEPVDQPTIEWQPPFAVAGPTPTPTSGDLGTATVLDPPHAPLEAASGGFNGPTPFDPPHAPAAVRPRGRADQLIEAADRRPLVIALLALVLVALLGRAVVERRG